MASTGDEKLDRGREILTEPLEGGKFLAARQGNVTVGGAPTLLNAHNFQEHSIQSARGLENEQ